MPQTVARFVGEAWRTLARERETLTAQRGDILRSQMEVSAIPAPTGAEEQRAEWVTTRLATLGLDVRRDDAGNVIGRPRGSPGGAPVVLCAHLDTVFPAGTPLEVRARRGRVSGPGICDNARGLAVMLAVAGAVQRRADVLAGAVEFVATTGEEGTGDLRGARHYLASGERPVALVALDGAGDERIVNAALGARRFRITYRGPGGHSWASFGSANPVHAAGRAIAILASLPRARGVESALTVSRVSGGRSVNSIPDEAWIEVDARSTSESALGALEVEIHAVARATAAEENERRVRGSAALSVACERIGHRGGGVTPEDAPIVRAAIEATRLVGRSPALGTASTDANAAIALGIPAIAIGGGGRGGDSHSVHEWYDDHASSAGVQRALTLVAALARLPAD